MTELETSDFTTSVNPRKRSLIKDQAFQTETTLIRKHHRPNFI